ncbi:hypothetical protein [Roseomonas fluvialis]|uniref:hypothetical protein n=1 Tax=Roseomonas fluvialis TaxID=1750527 RepID=UPI001FCE0260|nr:hypothetical protein [Roseomonas fluvialis]
MIWHKLRVRHGGLDSPVAGRVEIRDARLSVDARRLQLLRAKNWHLHQKLPHFNANVNGVLICGGLGLR